jgi:hypothetical protein
VISVRGRCFVIKSSFFFFASGGFAGGVYKDKMGSGGSSIAFRFTFVHEIEKRKSMGYGACRHFSVTARRVYRRRVLVAFHAREFPCHRFLARRLAGVQLELPTIHAILRAERVLGTAQYVVSSPPIVSQCGATGG